MCKIIRNNRINNKRSRFCLSKQKIIREDQKELKYLEDNNIEYFEKYQETVEN